MSESKTCVVVAWHRKEQIQKFMAGWIEFIGGNVPDWVILQCDLTGRGCARTKNAGVQEAMRRGFETVVILDDDCEGYSLDELRREHTRALEPQTVALFETVTSPPSRGTPYVERTAKLPVAASMGFWTDVGDYDAPGQLIHGARKPMEFRKEIIYRNYFPLCGMNIAFRPKEWLPWCSFVDVPRFDDIWMGWLWQREAYRRGYVFNLAGPMVRHSRQSNVWQNLRDESKHLERNETLWRDIATHEKGDYESLRRLLPC